MAEIFIELPDAEEYADYYQAIPDPICLDIINVSRPLSSLHLPRPPPPSSSPDITS
jgi:hypothetical protein